ncbi:MAG: DNA gyrase inhibitor YacG [Alphaproteobacteria bacterium]
MNLAGKCPICQGAPGVNYRPFCSKRCADIDLGHWFNQTYSFALSDSDGERIPDPGSSPEEQIEGDE